MSDYFGFEFGEFGFWIAWRTSELDMYSYEKVTQPECILTLAMLKYLRGATRVFMWEGVNNSYGGSRHKFEWVRARA